MVLGAYTGNIIQQAEHPPRFKCIVYKTNKEYYEISTIYECVEKLSMNRL